MERMPNATDVLRRELGDGKDSRLKAFTEQLEKRLLVMRERNDESQARVLTRELVLALQAALLIRHAPSAVADAFCASRLGANSGSAFGLLPSGIDLRAIACRAAPAN
jgi:putative acyl-CoA dehydrogenase